MDLSNLVVGQRARIVMIDGGAHQYRQRLFAAGIRPGAKCQVVQCAPLGDPMKLLVDGHVIALRAAEAAVIQVVIIEEELV
jgi:ferrous iron transport protein A